MIFAINDALVLQALDGLTQEELWRSPAPANNPILWVAGHIVYARTTALKKLGEPVELGWNIALFDRGQPRGNPQEYPSGAEVVEKMRDLSPRLQKALASATEEQLAKPATIPIPGVKTVADELTFLALHESYHVGQLAYIRKGLGYPALVG